VTVAFDSNTSDLPHLRTGTLDVVADDVTFEVPLQAFMNTVCNAAGQYVYTVDSNGTFSRFDPRTLTYLDLGSLNCPTYGNPFSMNVDQHGVAWVLFTDDRIYRVDTTTAACTATSYVPDQQGFNTFGMGSVFDSSTGNDTLYLAASDSSALGTLSMTSFQVASSGSISLGSVELAGTGDGQLWAFAPADASASGQAVLGRIDRTTGATLEHYNMSNITSTGGFAMKFFGGAFYVFIGGDVWKVDRSSLNPTRTTPTTAPTRVLRDASRDIVGAGVSTCAPVQ
jgi:hypothetical protein